ncbi:MAG: hypothetical protein KDD62_02890, partial [Bdellovibrionales bacterium]|nr:hypothetical protein [Bdellovibrionales bacterium]
DQCDIGGYGFFQAVNFRTGGGQIVDYSVDAAQPFFNGGISDRNDDGDKDQNDLTDGYEDGAFQAVIDAHVESTDFSSTEPYKHDGALNQDDIRLDSNTGGILPAVSSLGEKGAPVSPNVLMGAQKVVIQSAYPEPPSTSDGSAGEGGGAGGDGAGSGSDSEDVPPPETVPINTYNLPVTMLTFKESASE